MSLGEIFVELGVVGDTKDLEKFDKKLKEAAKNAESLTSKFIKTTQGVANLVAGFVVAITVTDKFTQQLVATNQELLNLTRTSDIAQNTFQKWNNIGQMLGVNNAAQQLKGLEERLTDLRITGQGAEGFALAGVNPMDSPEGVMEQLRNRVSGMDDRYASFLLRRIGIDPQMLHLLRMSTKEFNELNEAVEKFRFSPEQTRNIQMMNIQLQIARIKLNYLKDRAILAIMPAFTKFMTALSNIAVMLAKAGKNLANFVIKWRGLIAGIVLALSRFKPFIDIMTKLSALFKTVVFSLGQWITKIPIIGRLLGVLGGTIARFLFPITGAFLLLEDLAVFFQGGNSALGLIIDGFKEFAKNFANSDNKLLTILEALATLMETLLNLLQNILGLPILDWLQNIENFVRNIVNKILEIENYYNSNNQAGIKLQGILSNGNFNPDNFLSSNSVSNVNNNNQVNNVSWHNVINGFNAVPDFLNKQMETIHARYVTVFGGG